MQEIGSLQPPLVGGLHGERDGFGVAPPTDRVPDEVWRGAVADRQRFLLREWVPGMTTDGT